MSFGVKWAGVSGPSSILTSYMTQLPHLFTKSGSFSQVPQRELERVKRDNLRKMLGIMRLDKCRFPTCVTSNPHLPFHKRAAIGPHSEGFVCTCASSDKRVEMRKPINIMITVSV